MHSYWVQHESQLIPASEFIPFHLNPIFDTEAISKMCLILKSPCLKTDESHCSYNKVKTMSLFYSLWMMWAMPISQLIPTHCPLTLQPLVEMDSWELLFFFLRFYLFIHERHRERGRDIGRGRSRLPVGSPMWDSIPGPQDQDLSQRQTLNHRATRAPLAQS